MWLLAAKCALGIADPSFSVSNIEELSTAATLRAESPKMHDHVMLEFP